MAYTLKIINSVYSVATELETLFGTKSLKIVIIFFFTALKILCS